jgi:acyl-CoA reductase-like NAD-dependent aldehyde dehydrogenase
VEPPRGLDTGSFIRLTVCANVHNDMTIAQENIRGPVLALVPYDTEGEMRRLVGETPYGLARGIWSGDLERATRVARHLRAGQMSINSGRDKPNAPFGR